MSDFKSWLLWTALSLVCFVSGFVTGVQHEKDEQRDLHYTALASLKKVQASEDVKPTPESCLKVHVAIIASKYRVTGTNECTVTIPTSRLTVKFYNSENVRIGVEDGLRGPNIISMAAGEKMQHAFDIPAEILSQETHPVTAEAEVHAEP